jgi:hypothetical protein
MKRSLHTSKPSPRPRTFGARSLTAAQLARVSGSEDLAPTPGEEADSGAYPAHGYIKIKKLNTGD